MKKSKNSYWIKENLVKYRIKFLIIYIMTFLSSFILLSVLAYVSISKNYLEGPKSMISDYVARLKEADDKGFLLKPNDNSRMTVVYYYSNTDTTDIREMSRYTEGHEINDSTIVDCDKIKYNEYKTVSIEEGKYLRYIVDDIDISFKIVSGSRETARIVSIYIDISGEIFAQKQIVKTYVICILVMLFLTITLSLFMTYRNMKPIATFVDKQIEFLSDASHELRTPLAIVQSKIENILTNPDNTIYEVSEDLAISLKELSRLTKLTEELLTLARSDQNNISLNLEKVNMDKLIEEIVEPFKELADLSDRKINYYGVPAICKVDRDKIKQIMIILLDNALKYTNPKDYIEIMVSVKYFEVIIEVKDTGIGISEETRKKMFERFYREDKARSRQDGGNGLGLSIAKTLVQMQKGRIYADHNVPKGTKIVISFPRIE